MNILFLTLCGIGSLEERGIYTDLLREFRGRGHRIYALTPVERREGRDTYTIKEENALIFRIRTGNIQKTGIIEKGISTMTLDRLFLRTVRRCLAHVRFGLVLYSTPPITFGKTVEYVKQRDGAGTFLLLKDIFPQNAVDLGMMTVDGFGGVLYRYFRRKEKKLYHISDYIGCMSEKNVEYVLDHNPELEERNRKAQRRHGREIVGICSNSLEPVDKRISDREREEVRDRYGIPKDRTVFLYGGNLGRPQGIEFMLKCFHNLRDNKDLYFLLVGSGTEVPRIQRYLERYRPENIRLYGWLPTEEYDSVAAACDVGMIFLDHRFTIPNFPSRILGYMSAGLPVLACTDACTDLGRVIRENGIGWWCESHSVEEFQKAVKAALAADRKVAGAAAYECMKEKYNVGICCGQILACMEKGKGTFEAGCHGKE